MSSFPYKGKMIYFEETGAGNPLLLLHGNTVCGKMFGLITSAFAENHQVIVI